MSLLLTRDFAIEVAKVLNVECDILLSAMDQAYDHLVKLKKAEKDPLEEPEIELDSADKTKTKESKKPTSVAETKPVGRKRSEHSCENCAAKGVTKGAKNSLVEEGEEHWYCGTEKSGCYKSKFNKLQKDEAKKVKESVQNGDGEDKKKSKSVAGKTSFNVEKMVKTILAQTEIKEAQGKNTKVVQETTSRESQSDVSVESEPSEEGEVKVKAAPSKAPSAKVAPSKAAKKEEVKPSTTTKAVKESDKDTKVKPDPKSKETKATTESKKPVKETKLVEPAKPKESVKESKSKEIAKETKSKPTPKPPVEDEESSVSLSESVSDKKKPTKDDDEESSDGESVEDSVEISESD